MRRSGARLSSMRFDASCARDRMELPLDWALYYTETLGWHIFPLFTPTNGVCDCPPTYKADGRCSPGKHPRTIKGHQDASNDPEKVRRWWTIWPHANIGLNLLASGLVDVAPDSVDWHAE